MDRIIMLMMTVITPVLTMGRTTHLTRINMMNVAVLIMTDSYQVVYQFREMIVKRVSRQLIENRN